MTDIHNHLLFGIDDGARTIEDSITVLRDMEMFGYKNVILTPHIASSAKEGRAVMEMEAVQNLFRGLGITDD